MSSLFFDRQDSLGLCEFAQMKRNANYLPTTRRVGTGRQHVGQYLTLPEKLNARPTRKIRQAIIKISHR